MNYMPEVAKMLGVELGEEINVGTIGVRYVLTNDGLFYSADGSRCDHILINILTDKTNIKYDPWKPSKNETFYFVDEDGVICSDEWINCWTDNILYRIGNCYRTKDAAEKDISKWIAFYRSNEVLEI